MQTTFKKSSSISSSAPKKVRKHYLLHYWDIYRHFSSKTIAPRPQAPRVDKHSLFYLDVIKQSQIGRLIMNNENILSIWQPDIAAAIDKHFFSSSLDLLRTACQRNPSNWLLKSCLAYYYSKEKSTFVLADEIVSQGIKQLSSPGIVLSMYMIRLKIFKKINNAREKGQEDSLQENSEINQTNIQKHLKLKDLFESLKEDIAQQLIPQKRFWAEFQTPEPNCTLLLELAHQIFDKMRDIRKGWKHFREFIDSNFPEPLLIYGLYQIFAQNDSIGGDKILKQYYDIQRRNQEDEKLNSKMSIRNLFETIRLTVCGSQDSLGKILECSNNIERIIGFQKETVRGKSINTLIPSFLSDKEGDSATKIVSSGMLNKTKEILIVNKEGYLVACWSYVSLKFLPEAGLCYYILVSPLNDKTRVILLQESGKIINYSKDFENDSGLTTAEVSNINIFLLCPELEGIVEAFSCFFRAPDKAPLEFKTNYVQSSPVSLEFLENSHKNTEKRKKLWPKKSLLQDLHVKFSKGSTLSFYFSLNGSYKNPRSQKKQYIAISYHAKVEAFIYQEEVTISVFLKKMAANKAEVDSMTSNALNAPDIDDARTLQPEDNRGQITESDSFHLLPVASSSNVSKENKSSPETLKKKSTFRKPRKVPILTEEVSYQSDDNLAVDTITSYPRHINIQKERLLKTVGSNFPSTGQYGEKNNLMTEGDDLISPLGSPGERALLNGQKRDLVLHATEDNLYTGGNLLGKDRIASQLLVRQSEGDQDVDIKNIEDTAGKYIKFRTMKKEERNEKGNQEFHDRVFDQVIKKITIS